MSFSVFRLCLLLPRLRRLLKHPADYGVGVWKLAERVAASGEPFSLLELRKKAAC